MIGYSGFVFLRNWKAQFAAKKEWLIWLWLITETSETENWKDFCGILCDKNTVLGLLTFFVAQLSYWITARLLQFCVQLNLPLTTDVIHVKQNAAWGVAGGGRAFIQCPGGRWCQRACFLGVLHGWAPGQGAVSTVPATQPERQPPPQVLRGYCLCLCGLTVCVASPVASCLWAGPSPK